MSTPAIRSVAIVRHGLQIEVRCRVWPAIAGHGRSPDEPEHVQILDTRPPLREAHLEDPEIRALVWERIEERRDR